MTLKMTFLGSGSAFTVGAENFQSNILFEIEQDTMLIDAGTDIRHALRLEGRNYLDIKSVYLSHLHGDHTGGLEWLALTSYFDPNYKDKPKLFTSVTLVNDLWNKSLSAGLSTLENMPATLATFFDVHPIAKGQGFTWHGIDFNLVQTVHFFSDHELMPSYGLLFTYNKQRVFFSSDTQFTPDKLMPFYEEADIIFHDCETMLFKSSVHAHYTELVGLPAAIKKKMWLYHYNPGTLPDAVKDGFCGFVVRGQCFTF